MVLVRKMGNCGLSECFVLFTLLLMMEIRAISIVEANVQNAITEEERRGADNTHAIDNNAKKNGKFIDDNADKKTRGIHTMHSPSASHKHQSFFVPSGYDSHIAATGHAGASYSVGSTSGYDYVGGNHGSSPTAAGPAQGHAHGHIHHHNGPTGYASATGFGGYGLASYGHGGPNGGGHGGLGGLGGHGSYGHSAHGGHDLYGGGGFHNALALKGLLIPLAGIALLGAAAALSTNPVLLQLGVVNGKRRRRSIRNAEAQYMLRSALGASASKHYPENPHVKPDSDY